MATAFTELLRKLFKIFKSFFMKKLLFIIGCMSIVVTISSCSTESMQDIKKINSENQNQFSEIPADSLAPRTTDIQEIGKDDKDKVRE
ncbi:hypothetical protein ACMDB5_09865 [Flavobacterium sp. W1B]|uniref:hypothetical protein n=1 Tax=Flavobacterium sp. W1B TaxID=3394146 RepID=UPI0039BCA759